jgi:C4-dicarboxylate transporter, DctM subunit
MTWLMLVLPVALLVLGFPFFLVLLAAVTLTIVGFTSVPPTAIPQIMFGSIGNFALLAVPFFIFAGELMARGGMARRLIVVVMAMFGGFRGSMPITTAAQGRLQREILDRRHHLCRLSR